MMALLGVALTTASTTVFGKVGRFQRPVDLIGFEVVRS